MTTSITNKAQGSTGWSMDFAFDSVTGNIRQMVFLTDPSTGLLVGSSTSPFAVTSLSSSAITNPISTLTRPANTTAYAANDLIADNVTAGSVGSYSFAIATSAGGSLMARVRMRTNVTTGWDAVNLSINLWSAAPTYTNGDNAAYVVATGSANWLANFLITLTQFGDGAVGAGPLTSANELALHLTSGTSVFWDMQILSAATPISGQTFKLTAELLN